MIDVWFEQHVNGSKRNMWYYKRISLPEVPWIGSTFEPYYYLLMDNEPTNYDGLTVKEVRFFEQPKIIMCVLSTYEWPFDGYPDFAAWCSDVDGFFSRIGWSADNPVEEFNESLTSDPNAATSTAPSAPLPPTDHA